MRIPRIFVPDELKEGDTVVLPDGPARHVTRVLRLVPGAPLILFNGRGGEYRGRLRVTGRRIEVEIEDFDRRDAESPLRMTLAQGISRGERMDYTIQKAVELGVARIVPLFTEHCVVRLSGERLDRRIAHWRAVAAAACEQCGRNRIPEIEPARTLRDWLHGLTAEPAKLLLDPQAERGPRDLAHPEGGAILLIGPEGGLSAGERGRAMEAGFTSVRLGPRVLRTETAAVAALATLQLLWGDLG